jgi:hypothetical protein
MFKFFPTGRRKLAIVLIALGCFATLGLIRSYWKMDLLGWPDKTGRIQICAASTNGDLILGANGPTALDDLSYPYVRWISRSARPFDKALPPQIDWKMNAMGVRYGVGHNHFVVIGYSWIVVLLMFVSMVLLMPRRQQTPISDGHAVNDGSELVPPQPEAVSLTPDQLPLPIDS